MLILRQLLNAVGPGDWIATSDLKAAYFLVVIHPDHRQFLRFAYENIVLRIPGAALSVCSPHLYEVCRSGSSSHKREGYLHPSLSGQLGSDGRHIRTMGFSMNFQKKKSLIPSQKF